MGYVGRFALGERLRRQERQRRRKRKLSADGALPERVAKRRKRDVRKRTGRKQQQQRTGRTQQRTGRTQQLTGRTQQPSGRTQQRTGRKQQCLDSRRRQRTAFGSAGAGNMDGSRQDPWAEEDHPFKRFKANHGLFRAAVEEQLREWPEMAVSMSQQPCLLCEADFGDRSALLQHIDDKHGGLQRYRNAMLMLESLSPHVVVGSEVRQYVRNYATFLREARIDWDGADDVSLRRRLGCCFCARSFWKEDLLEVLAGQQCFMLNPDAVWKFLSVERYKQRWPLIPESELLASSVSVSDSFGQKVQVLLHKRHSLTHSLARSLARSLAPSLTHSLTSLHFTSLRFASLHFTSLHFTSLHSLHSLSHPSLTHTTLASLTHTLTHSLYMNIHTYTQTHPPSPLHHSYTSSSLLALLWSV